MLFHLRDSIENVVDDPSYVIVAKESKNCDSSTKLSVAITVPF